MDKLNSQAFDALSNKILVVLMDIFGVEYFINIMPLYCCNFSLLSNSFCYFINSQKNYAVDIAAFVSYKPVRGWTSFQIRKLLYYFEKSYMESLAEDEDACVGMWWGRVL